MIVIEILMEAKPIDNNIEIRSPIKSIDGVWKFSHAPGSVGKCYSLPGHLLHLVEKGSYRLKVNNREYQIVEGDLIYYHGSEIVEWFGNETEVIFYSVGFTAPDFPPLPLECRVFQSTEEPKVIFQKLYETSLEAPSSEKALVLFSELSRLLALIEQIRGQFKSADKTEDNWGKVEAYFYSQQNFRPSIEELCKFLGCSRSTIVRLCKKATGMAPLARLQAIRMAEAKALLKSTTLNVTHVAEYLGYPRIHEFSREFSGYFGQPPTAYERSVSKND